MDWNTIWCQVSSWTLLELISSETQRLIRLVNENLDYEEDSFEPNCISATHRFAGIGAIQTVVEQIHSAWK